MTQFPRYIVSYFLVLIPTTITSAFAGCLNLVLSLDKEEANLVCRLLCKCFKALFHLSPYGGKTDNK
uniref:Putative mitochondrial solute carrier protein n=1 Tax=Ixodes scapularis TaxID=6945 RepID=A0A4D5RX48_IXOSC